MENGWIKIYRKLLDDPLWKDCNHAQKVIMITILLMANHKTSRCIFDGKEIELAAGECITSQYSLAKKTGCSRQQVKSALAKFEKFGFLTQSITHKSTQLTIANWQKYQQVQNKDGEQVTQSLTQSLTQYEPSGNPVVTQYEPSGNPKQECKNEKNNIYIKNKKNAGARVYTREEKISNKNRVPTPEELEKYDFLIEGELYPAVFFEEPREKKYTRLSLEELSLKEENEYE